MNRTAAQPDYIQKIDEMKEDLIRDLCDLVRCDSVRRDPEPDAPFGPGVARALEAMLAMGRREGLRAKDTDHMYGMLEWGREDAAGLFGILCHLDVVPEGNGWTHEPFQPEIEDGRIYGRGTLDDKGPAMAAFYALKALKDCGYEPAGRVRMIFGLNEETGEESIAYYREHEELPDFSIVPDSDFPVVRGEMGIMVFDLVYSFGRGRKDGFRLLSVSGGSAPNMVPDRAEAVIDAGERAEELAEYVLKYAMDTDTDFLAETDGARVTVRSYGTAAHGAMPWKGKNAVSRLLHMLSTIPFSSEEVNEVLDFYKEHIGYDLHGERLGIALRDETSGKLIFNVGMIRMDEEELRITVNVRVPVTMNSEHVYEGMAALVCGASFHIEERMYQPPIYFSRDDARIQKLVDIYRKHAGDYETEPLVIGGGTYARQFDNAVAFGAMYPGDPDTMHAKDEYIRIDRLVQTAKIYAETLYEFAIRKPEESC